MNKINTDISINTDTKTTKQAEDYMVKIIYKQISPIHIDVVYFQWAQIQV